MTSSAAVVLPADLAPALRRRVLDLLAQVPLAPAVPPLLPAGGRSAQAHRCVVCHRGGLLGGHHAAGGEVVWIHRACHRRLHRRGYGARRRSH